MRNKRKTYLIATPLEHSIIQDLQVVSKMERLAMDEYITYDEQWVLFIIETSSLFDRKITSKNSILSLSFKQATNGKTG